MRDGQLIQLLKEQATGVQEWMTGRLADHRKTTDRTHTISVETHLRLQALTECLLERPRLEVWGIKLPIKLALTADEVEMRYKALIEKIRQAAVAKDDEPEKVAPAGG